MDLLPFDTTVSWTLFVLMLWVLPWKGVALWKAARLSHRNWFIALFLLNTLALLDIYYIFFVASKYKVETEEVEEEAAEPEREQE